MVESSLQREAASAEAVEERWERRFFWPVLVAALAAIPAMFLTMLGGTAQIVGEALNLATMGVFAAETIVLLLLARDRRTWLREHWFVVTVTALTVPAVALALGPVQVLRLVRFVRVLGALRIIRVGRIIKAGRILYERSNFSGPVRAGLAAAATVAAALFVALVLSDPTAESRQFLEDIFGDAWAAAVVVAGLILAAATFVVARQRTAEREQATEEHEGD